jgi:hypothetical protein
MMFAAVVGRALDIANLFRRKLTHQAYMNLNVALVRSFGRNAVIRLGGGRDAPTANWSRPSSEERLD